MAKHNHHALATCVPADVFDAYFAAGIRLVEDHEHARVALRNLSRNHAENRSRIGAADLPKFDVYVPCFEAMPVNLVVLMRAECVDGTG